MSNIMQKYCWLIPNINPHDETFEELLPQVVWNFQHTNDVWKQKKKSEEQNPYNGLKQELETLLTTRDIDEIEEVMVKSENSRYIDRDKNARFFERIYHEIYKDDPEYKPELVKTPIEELLKMHF